MTMLERNKKIQVAIIMTLISIVLLIVYGTDALLERSDEGFLPFDARVRGFALGVPSVVLPILAFLIARRFRSSGLGTLLLIDGIILLIGSVGFVSLQETTRTVDNATLVENFRSFAPIIAMGGLVTALGIWKIANSSGKP